MTDRDAARRARIDTILAARAKAATPKPTSCVFCGDRPVCGGDRPVCAAHTDKKIAERIEALEKTVADLTRAES